MAEGSVIARIDVDAGVYWRSMFGASGSKAS